MKGYRSYCRLCGYEGHVPDGLRRPLQLPELSGNEPCPVERPHTVNPEFSPALGTGPVYPILTPEQHVLSFQYPPSKKSPFAGSEWGGAKVLWVGRPSYRGPVLVRGGQIDGSNPLGFEGGKVPFGELQLHDPPGPGGWADWPTYTRVRAPGCYAYQIDGTTFSRIVVFRAVIAEQ
jgi:hypothetical protein